MPGARVREPKGEGGVPLGSATIGAGAMPPASCGAGRTYGEGRVGGILKFFGSVVGIIFLIGLLVVIGLLMLIF